jgi:uncharacterized damage-inducible protein DinB
MSYVEPWMTRRLRDMHPVLAGLLYSLEHARDDIRKWTEGLTPEQFSAPRGDIAPPSFHVMHIAGSVDRLLTYARGEQLTDEQFRQLQDEKREGITREEALAYLDAMFANAEQTVRAIDPSQIGEARFIGRKRIEVTLGGLLIHTAEHTQRHTGELIVTAKAARR